MDITPLPPALDSHGTEERKCLATCSVYMLLTALIGFAIVATSLADVVLNLYWWAMWEERVYEMMGFKGTDLLEHAGRNVIWGMIAGGAAYSLWAWAASLQNELAAGNADSKAGPFANPNLVTRECSFWRAAMVLWILMVLLLVQTFYRPLSSLFQRRHLAAPEES